MKLPPMVNDPNIPETFITRHVEVIRNICPSILIDIFPK